MFTYDDLAKTGLNDGKGSDPLRVSLATALKQFAELSGERGQVTISIVLEPATRKSGVAKAERQDVPLLIPSGNGAPVGVKVVVCTMAPVDLSDQAE